MKIAVQGQAADVEVIRELLSPWNVSFTSLDEAEVVIVYKEKPLETKKTIIIPSDSADFMKWIEDLKSRVARKLGKPVSIAAGSQTVLTITPEMLYCYDGLIKSDSGEALTTSAKLGENMVFLTLDVVKEYNNILSETLNAKLSTVYRLLTGLPVPYTLAPRWLRDLFMNRYGEQESLTLCDKLPVDALRFILIRAIEKLPNMELQRKTWDGKKYACIITHDIDTRKGLRRAGVIKKLEEKYDVPSAWYIPSKHYKLNLETIKYLANHGEMGAHGTKHDGILAQLPKERLVERLHEAKQTLEKIVNCPVSGFRAPLLQHSLKIIKALREAGYKYDASIPTWEPKHPCTMRAHGIGTTYPINIEGVIEIPLTLPQDHQMLYALGMTSKQTVKAWIKLKEEIRDILGVFTILVHPDYKLADSENLKFYEELLSDLTTDSHTWITLPRYIINA